MHNRIRRIVPVVVLLGISAAAVYYFSSLAEAQNGALRASGTIEATQVRIASEVGGRVVEVLVEEGEAVEAGQALVRFDDAVLQAQLAQAETVLAQAEAGYDQAVALSELERLGAQQALDALYENEEVARAQAELAVADARDAVRDAERWVNNVQEPGSEDEIAAAQARVVLAEQRLDQAKEDYERVKNRKENDPLRAAALLALNEAQDAYDLALRLLAYATGNASPIDVGQAEATLKLAQELFTKAETDLEKLQDGPDPDALELAEARLASVDGGLAVALAQVDSAQAAIETLQVQLAKTVVTAPMSGTVLVRSVEVGEMLAPGAPLLTLGNLDDLTIAVYLPEDRYGVVSLGDEARVEVDSFPGKAFSGMVVRIADEAEFTPRNVQTTEGRRTTVFEVKLSVDNPGGELKPGMPADVTFQD